jgi:hypothetical protein
VLILAVITGLLMPRPSTRSIAAGTPYINGLDYGIPTDGVTPADAMLKNAIAACSASGCRLLLPASCFLLPPALRRRSQRARPRGCDCLERPWSAVLRLHSTKIKTCPMR